MKIRPTSFAVAIAFTLSLAAVMAAVPAAPRGIVSACADDSTGPRASSGTSARRATRSACTNCGSRFGRAPRSRTHLSFDVLQNRSSGVRNLPSAPPWGQGESNPRCRVEGPVS